MEMSANFHDCLPIKRKRIKKRTEKLKCIVVGDTKTGKSSAVQLFINEEDINEKFDIDKIKETEYCQIIHKVKVLTAENVKKLENAGNNSFHVNDEIILEIIDTSGKDEFKENRKVAYKNVDVILIAVDLQDKKSLQRANGVFCPEIQKFAPGRPVILGLMKDDNAVPTNDDVVQKVESQRKEQKEDIDSKAPGTTNEEFKQEEIEILDLSSLEEIKRKEKHDFFSNNILPFVTAQKITSIVRCSSKDINVESLFEQILIDGVKNANFDEGKDETDSSSDLKSLKNCRTDDQCLNFIRSFVKPDETDEEKRYRMISLKANLVKCPFIFMLEQGFQQAVIWTLEFHKNILGQP